MVDGVSVFQVHHGLPQDLAKNDVVKLLAGRGLFDIEATSNKIALPNDSALSAATGVARHASSHPALRDAADNSLNESHKIDFGDRGLSSSFSRSGVT